ncbi:hypothetical protein GCM10023322_68610 [Rugosimonospora acidiphila]|uniref:ATP/GTP-binding protein n=1 Tax=Rugosimonospora acidiphila TaxID=556531 RepID=A0ABP9SMM0_9ACTN
MRRLTTVLTATAVLVLAITLAPIGRPAFAGAWGSVDCRKTPSNPQCLVTVGTSGGPGSPGTTASSACHDPNGTVVPCSLPGVGWLADDGCYYQPATGDELAAAEAAGGILTPPAQWYVGQCGYPPVPGLTQFRVFGSAPGPQLLADMAVKALRLPAPVIRTNPSVAAQVLIRVPVWLWLDSWGDQTATASVPGMSVTATARPTRVVWSPGDGTSVACTGAGTPWSAGDDPASASPTCGHTYLSTSAGAPGNAFTLTAAVTWQVSWAGGGQTGTAPDMQTTAQVGVTVGTSQTVTIG